MTAPPATSNTTPVTQDASSEARKRAARATSSGVPSRLSGWSSFRESCWALGMRSRLRSKAFLFPDKVGGNRRSTTQPYSAAKAGIQILTQVVVL